VHLHPVSPAQQKPAFSPDARVAASPSWFAVQTRSRFEFSVRDQLRIEGVEEFLPTWDERVKWSDREKVTTRPLFNGYIFARFDPADAPLIRQVRGIVTILSTDQIPISIPDDEIADLRQVIESTVPSPLGAYVVGGKVTVKSGAFAGASAVIARIKGGTLLTLMIPMFGRDTPVEIEAADCVKKADAPKAKK
jgi:transcription antitermination factor NusG